MNENHISFNSNQMQISTILPDSRTYLVNRHLDAFVETSRRPIGHSHGWFAGDAVITSSVSIPEIGRAGSFQRQRTPFRVVSIRNLLHDPDISNFLRYLTVRRI